MIWRGWLTVPLGISLYLLAGLTTAFQASFYSSVLLIFLVGQGLHGVFDARVIAMTGWLSLPIPLIWWFGTPTQLTLASLAYCPLVFLYFWPTTYPLWNRIMRFLFGSMNEDTITAILKTHLKWFIHTHAPKTPAGITVTLPASLTSYFGFYKTLGNPTLEGLESLIHPEDTSFPTPLHIGRFHHLFRKQLNRSRHRWAITSHGTLKTSYHESAHDTMARISVLK